MRFRSAATAAGLLLQSTVALAYSGGISTDSFGMNGCNDCHGGGNDPVVEVIGPEFVAPLSTHEYTVRISATDLQPSGGFNLDTNGGALNLGGKYSAQTTIVTTGAMEEQLTHSSAKAASGDFVQFSFLWTAPASFSTVDFSVWGNAVDATGGTANDKAAQTTFVIANGDLGLCPPSPGPCTPFGKSAFAYSDQTDDAKDSFSFTAAKGSSLPSASLGNPTTSTDYFLCVYKDALLVREIDIPAATLCNGVPCWSVKGDPMSPDAYSYKDKIAAPHGVRTGKFVAGTDSDAKVVLKGKGVNLPDTAFLPIGASTLTVQLMNSTTSMCVGESFSGSEITKDVDGKLKAKAVAP